MTADRCAGQPERARAGVPAFGALVAALLLLDPLHAAEPAFPGAEGWAAGTPGGRGGRILRVTTLAPTGPGSLLEALHATGPRIIVFEVGGVIDLDRQKVTLREPFLTIAGQTAPSPGVTIIRNGIFVQAHDVVIRHIRVRPGEAGRARKSGWDADGITCADGARDVIIDHCSLTWATDENADIWGPPFKGETPEEWRANNVRRIIRQVRDGAGRVIDSETQGGGYPVASETRVPFDAAEWDLSTMTRRTGHAGQ